MQSLRTLVSVSGAGGNAPGGSVLTALTEMLNGRCGSRWLNHFPYGQGGKRRLGCTLDLWATGAMEQRRQPGLGDSDRSD